MLNHKVSLETFISLHPQVKHIQCQLVDYSNSPRAQCITVSRALEMSHPNDNRIPSLTSFRPLLHGVDRYDNDLPIVSEHWEDTEWIPDWTTIKLSSSSPKTAVVSVWTRSTYALSKTGDPFSSCPRTILQRLVSRAQSDHKIKVKIGYEIEFILLDSPTATGPIETGHTFLSPGETRHPGFRVVKDAVEHLEECGIKVWKYHPEGAPFEPGQYEIALSPCDPLEAADNVLYAMGVIKEQAQKHGYLATCAPRPFEKRPTQGLHTHLSLTPVSLADCFVAGILDRLPETTVFLLGGYDSYSQHRRAEYGLFAFSGKEKNAPLRERGQGHWEFRMPDTFGNPYLQLAALIATGLEGIREQKSTVGRPKSKAEIEAMSVETRAELGVGLIPKSLEQALDRLEEDKSWWGTHLGEVTVEGYTNTRRAEIKASEKMTMEERRKVTLLAV